MDGVIDVHLNMNIRGAYTSTVENSALSALEDLFRVDWMGEIFDNVLLCLPYGSLSGSGRLNWVAYAGVNGYRSVYNGDFWCANEVTQLHELGHNMGL